MNKREMLRKKRSQQQRRKLLMAILIILAAGALFTVAILLPKVIMERARYSGVEGFTIGNQNAPVTVVQFSSFSCGFCADFSKNQEPDLIAKYVEPGHVFYRFVNIPSSNEPSQIAAKASYCAADQNGFFEYKDFLYANSASEDGFSDVNLVNYAGSAGLDAEKFQSCLNSDTYSTAFQDDIAYAQTVGITFTPSFLVNDQLVSASELYATIDGYLEQ